MMITGRNGKTREIKVDTKRLFGKKSKGAVNPPPYTVQIEVSSRDPQRIADQNQMFMEAYTMSAQAQQFFPLSSLFNILNLDGKDKILPVIRENEHYQEQMQALQQQVEQMSQQMEQMNQENQNLKRTVNQTTNALAQMSARRGGQAPQGPAGPEGMPQPEGLDRENPIVGGSINMAGVPTGAALPT
jgi:TolA-binding protein